MEMMKTLQQGKEDTEMPRISEHWSVDQALVSMHKQTKKAMKTESKGCISLLRWLAACVS
jgi:hypothetical protein